MLTYASGRGEGYAEEETGASIRLSVLDLLVLYWYKSTNTDTGARQAC